MVVFFWFNGGKTVRDSSEAEVLAITIREALRIFKSFIATQLIAESHLENGITWIRDWEKPMRMHFVCNEINSVIF